MIDLVFYFIGIAGIFSVLLGSLWGLLVVWEYVYYDY